PKEYEIFQQTQLALFKSHFVLNAALNRSDISQLDAVVKEEPDALAWLSDELKVSFPGEGEILEVRFDGEEDPAEIMKLVDAVIDAFIDEVIYKERTRSSVTRESLKKLHKQLVVELQEKMDRFQTLSKELDSSDSASTSAMLSMLTSDVRMIQQQIIKKKEELLDIEVMKTLAVQQANSTSALEAAIQEEMARDPMIQSFQQEQFTVTQQMTQLRAITKRKNPPEVKRLQQHLETLKQQIQEYRITKEAELRSRFKSAPNDLLAQVMSEYMIRRRSAERDLVELQEQYEEKMEEVQRKGQTSGPLAILESTITQLQEVERTMDLKLRSRDVEEKAGQDRVRVMQPASSQEKINEIERYTIAVLGALTAFCSTCYCVALLEFRRRRLNGPADVDEGLGIRVLGVLPSVSSRKAMLPGSLVAAQLSESIDGIRAILMHDSTTQARQVVLVTSPASMEGCTTVASHLALSLTRAGRRTLLVDGDLREPSLHKLFGMPVEDGMCEVLRSEIDIAEAIRPTNTEGLWLMTAGQCDADAVHALATDQLQPIFEKLRAEFDFVIIDGAPLLGLSDSISIGQYVDGAILTLLRDHSEIRKVLQSAELLKNMGIQLFGAVVNGVHQKADRRVARLHRTTAKPPRKLTAGAES
ncbi:MAG: polysaccharide biosynthesis tyrosine autokinase, partial [Planctomycetes bacterium]|nr:polysaccharide biosynthesis tyrosine autokinase [Planctomycetota bacterium]